MLRNICLRTALLIGMLAAAAPALAATLTLGGEVTYRERIALPANASLRVRLVDMARPDAATVEAEAALANPGQVPLTFTLNFDDRVIDRTHAYALVAEITAEGAVWFRNAEPYGIDPLAPAAPIVIVVNFTGSLVSATEPAATVPPILDITWVAEEIGGEPVLPGSETSLAIAGDMRAGGRGGCNSYFAQARIDGDRLRFSAVAATSMACLAADITAQETSFFAALGDTRFWRMREDKLSLVDARGRELVRFARSAR